MARVEIHRPTLEDIFVEIVQGQQPAGRQDEQAAEDLRASLRLSHHAGELDAEEVAP